MRFVNQLKITKYTITILLKQLLGLKDFKFVKSSNEFERKKIFISISNGKKILIKENSNNAFEKKKKEN